MRGGQPRDAALVANFAGGSTPSDQQVPDLRVDPRPLDTHFRDFRDHVAGMNADEFPRKLANGRTVGESIVLLTWHEAHHQGQIHLTWNLYKQAHGVG